MENHAKEIDVSVFNRLWGEEVVALHLDARSYRFGLGGEDSGTPGDGVWEILNDETEMRECFRKGNTGAAGGAANLSMFVSMLRSFFDVRPWFSEDLHLRQSHPLGSPSQSQ